MRRSLPLLPAVLLAASLTAHAQVLVGVNQAWDGGNYGHDLTKSWSLPAWERVFDEAHAAKMRSLRVWLFEGMEGVLEDAQGLPSGVDPGLLDHVDRLADLAEARGLTVYWTLHDGNLHGSRQDDQRALCTNARGYGDAFRQRVLAPVLARLARRPRLVFAIDLLNEAQGSVKAKVWSDGWSGASRYLRTMACFIHQAAPGLRVSASSGHGEGVKDVLAGRFDGLGLDFFDVHVYSGGTIPSAAALAVHARGQGLPLVLGECGPNPSSLGARFIRLFGAKVTANYQRSVLRSFVSEAKRWGFKAVFPWRLEDAEPLFGLVVDRDARPALEGLADHAGSSRAAAQVPVRRLGIANRVGQ
ncbi:MAG: hypothetical protein AB7N76_00315 [Planctomycetota bacterium]